MNFAERGYITLAFDPSFTGESGGNVRLVSSSDINTEDFCAAVDYLSCLENVDEEKIGIIGICGFGGIAIRPSKQNNIYGYKASLWAYKKARELNISPILVTCYKSNKSSLRLLTSKYSDYFKVEEDIIEENGSSHEIMRFWYE